MTLFHFSPLRKEQILRSSTWGHHFFFLNAILAIVISFSYVYAAPHTESLSAFIYLLATWLGQSCFLAFLAFLILFFPLTFIGNFKLYRVLSVIFAFLLHCLLLIDAKIFLTVKVHITWMVTSLILRDLDFNTGLNFRFMYIAVLILILLEILFAKLATREVYKKSLRHNLFPNIVLSAIFMCFVASHGIYIWADATSYEKITNLRTVFPAHYPMTARSFLSNHGWIDDDDFTEASSEEKSSTSNFVYPLAEIKANPQDNPKNVIFILLNGMSYSDLNQTNTPFLMSLKMSNTSFEKHYLPYQNYEDNLFASSFGLPVQYKESFIKHKVEPVLVTEMQKQEYMVRVFTNSFLKKDVASVTSLLGLPINRVSALKNDQLVFEKALDFVDTLNSNQRFLISLNTNSLMYVARNKNAHAKALKELDEELKNFIHELSRRDILKQSLVMISSDIGNPMLLGNSTDYSMRQQHVPMIALWPNDSLKGISYNNLTSNFDIAPTLGLEILGVTTPCVNYSIGNSLLKIVNRDYLLTTQGRSLLLISNNAVTVYKRNGKVHIDEGGKIRDAKPNLENLIKAMRELNRFKG